MLYRTPKSPRDYRHCTARYLRNCRLQNKSGDRLVACQHVIIGRESGGVLSGAVMDAPVPSRCPISPCREANTPDCGVRLPDDTGIHHVPDDQSLSVVQWQLVRGPHRASRVMFGWTHSVIVFHCAHAVLVNTRAIASLREPVTSYDDDDYCQDNKAGDKIKRKQKVKYQAVGKFAAKLKGVKVDTPISNKALEITSNLDFREHQRDDHDGSNRRRIGRLTK